METLFFKEGQLHLLDQTRLPLQEEYLVTQDYLEVCDAIERLVVRGAPAIGVAAAYGLYLAAASLPEDADFSALLEERANRLIASRPTAVNLAWAVNRCRNRIAGLKRQEALPVLLREATDILEEDQAMNRKIGDSGASLFQKKTRILTHCNAGALATAGYGTALGVIRSAFSQGKVEMVYADETRPLLQGARLTVYELMKDGIPVTLITDSMAAWHMKQGLVDAIIVGADRIVANGDTANKIGTYNLAVLARYHNIPFYVAAPYSTFDLSLAEGSDIVIEERDGDEVRCFQGALASSPDARVSNPAFDVTPGELITAIITDRGILTPSSPETIRSFFDER